MSRILGAGAARMKLEAENYEARIAALEAQLAELAAENERLKELIRWAHDTLYEINPSNYDHDEVCKLNDASVEVILGLAPTLGENHGKSKEWWLDRATTLASTGVVKVSDIDRRAKEAADAIGVTPYSDMRLFVEQAVKYALSTLESAAPEGQQPVAVEALAEFLCSEFDFDLDPVPGASWPEHEKDDGYRGNSGYVRLQPSDVQARARENASRILTFISQITRPSEQAVTEAMVEVAERTMAAHYERPLKAWELTALHEALKAAMEAGHD